MIFTNIFLNVFAKWRFNALKPPNFGKMSQGRTNSRFCTTAVRSKIWHMLRSCNNFNNVI